MGKLISSSCDEPVFPTLWPRTKKGKARVPDPPAHIIPLKSASDIHSWPFHPIDRVNCN